MRKAGHEFTDSLDSGLPPGPKLPAVVQMAFGYRYPYQFLAACQRRYGDIFTVRAIPWGTVVYLADSVEIESMFAGDGETFHAGEARARFNAIVGDRSLLVLDGEAHRRCRRLVMPAFTGKAVQGQVEAMAAVVGQSIASWPLGQPIALHPRLHAILLEVFLPVVIGASDPIRRAELRAALPSLADLKRAIPFMLVRAVKGQHPALERYGPGRRYAQLLAHIDELLYAEIARARTDRELETRTDVLAMLVRARDEDGVPIGTTQVRDQLITLLLAGPEPVAAGLAWVFERLVRHPEILARARRAATDGDDSYLTAVIRETLRVRPIFDAVRQAARPIQVGGYRIPAGVVVIPAIGLVQRSVGHFTDPEDFRPERFLDTPPAAGSWLTFGGGVRRCLGTSFATVGMRTVLGEMLRQIDLEPTGGSPEPVRLQNMVAVPGRGAEVTLRAI